MTTKLTQGQRIGHWTLGTYHPATYEHRKKVTKAMWQCTCDCGTQRLIRDDNLRAGRTQRCSDCAPKIGRELALVRHGKDPYTVQETTRENLVKEQAFGNLLMAWRNLE